MKLICRPPAFISYKAFLKNKKRSGTILAALFSACFLKKIVSLVIFYQLKKFDRLVAFTTWDIEQCMDCNWLLTMLRRHKFWNKAYIYNKAVFSTRPKSQDKNLNMLRMKRAFKQKHFSSIIFKDFLLKQIKQISLGELSPTVKISQNSQKYNCAISIFFHVNFVKILRTLSLQNTSGRLLVKQQKQSLGRVLQNIT